MIGIQASHHCWCVLPEVIVYAYTQSAFYHLDPCNANPSGSQQSCRFLRSWLFGSSFAFSRQMLPNDCHQKRDGLISRAVSSPIQVSVQLQEQLMSMLSAHHWWRQSGGRLYVTLSEFRRQHRRSMGGPRAGVRRARQHGASGNGSCGPAH